MNLTSGEGRDYKRSFVRLAQVEMQGPEVCGEEGNSPSTRQRKLSPTQSHSKHFVSRVNTELNHSASIFRWLNILRPFVRKQEIRLKCKKNMRNTLYLREMVDTDTVICAKLCFYKKKHESFNE